MPETETIDAAEKAYAQASEKAVGDQPAAVPAEPAAKAKAPAKRVAKAKAAPSAKPAAKPAKARPVARTSKPQTTPTQRKDKTMAKTQTKPTEFTARLQTAVKDAQGRAKAALDKGQAQLADAGAFSKGNLEALVESGKILGSGLQAMTQSYVEEVKSTFAMVQDDVKALASVKSPSEFVELRREQLRKYFDQTVAYNSKSAEAALKLASEAFQPLSNRVALAVEKFQQAA